jgi:peptidoglycan LD-endopeptidase CwlK
MSRSINDLHPKLKKAAGTFLVRCAEKGIPVLITQTLRTIEEQNDLYAQGRTKPGKIVTYARGGESYHNYGLAFDFVILNQSKVPVWDTKADVNKNARQDYYEAGEIGEAVGLEWGGRWIGKKADFPHLQMTFGLSISDLKNGAKP